MLVSHQFKFIFIKTHKTAGSSLEDYLTPFCTDNGIVDTKKYQSHRPASSIKGMVGNDVWESYTKICPVRNPWDKMVSLYFWRKRKRPFYYHLIRLLRGKHPRPIEQRLDFESLLKCQKLSMNLDRPVMFVSSEWEDYFFIRFEHLQNDLESLCSRLKIPFHPEKLPNKKSGFRDDKNYRKFYNEETKQLVAAAFQEEIEKFNYGF